MRPDGLLKYPSTQHTINQIEAKQYSPYSGLRSPVWVVEEKLDGANAAVSIVRGQLKLQSRGHFLIGGPRERQFELFKTWANVHQTELKDILGERYVMFGEWTYSVHTIYYDALPHYFHEFDIYDKLNNVFLSTPRRHSILKGSCVISVPVLHSGNKLPEEQVLEMSNRVSFYTGPNWENHLKEDVTDDRYIQRTPISEGVYLKAETAEHTIGRYKTVRPEFIQTIIDADEHHMDRRIIPNRLAEGVDIWS